MEKDFEKELARKLNQRTIEPGANAWDRVKIQRNRREKKPVTWMYWVAAALVIGIGLGGIHSENGNSNGIQTATRNTKSLPEPKTLETNFEVAQKQEPLDAVGPKARAGTFYAETTSTRKQDVSLYQPVAEINQYVKEPPKQEVAHILKPEATRKSPQDEVDLLIENARREIAAGHGLSNTTDATTLLKDSESELDENFRSSVFENLFKHKKIKVALSGH